MSIKDMPHVTVEQVLALRKEAMKLEAENQALRKELEAVRVQAIKDIALEFCTDGDQKCICTYDELMNHAKKLGG